MTQEEKSLLLKDLCARLPYMVIMNVDVLNIDCLLCAVYQNKEHSDCVGIGDNGIASIERVKPYLRPMSSMTEEERNEVEEISHGWFYINKDGEIFPMGRLTDSGEFEDAILPTFEYFLKRHFDYRGLIEKGLALEAPEGMYNIKEK